VFLAPQGLQFTPKVLKVLANKFIRKPRFIKDQLILDQICRLQLLNTNFAP
jgi:hypothetical protein